MADARLALCGAAITELASREAIRPVVSAADEIILAHGVFCRCFMEVLLIEVAFFGGAPNFLGNAGGQDSRSPSRATSGAEFPHGINEKLHLQSSSG